MTAKAKARRSDREKADAEDLCESYSREMQGMRATLQTLRLGTDALDESVEVCSSAVVPASHHAAAPASPSTRRLSVCISRPLLTAVLPSASLVSSVVGQGRRLSVGEEEV